MTVTSAWRAHRAYLVNLAYQMLADIGDAEDVVQEAFLRFSAAPGDEIRDERAWLTVVTGRLSLDFLRSARVRHESPELTDNVDRAVSLHSRPSPDPADRLTLDDAVSHALTEVLARLSPGERVAFILHDVFGLPFDSIGDMTGRPAPTCRQLARRARAKVTRADPHASAGIGAAHRDVVDRFITACAGGDLSALVTVLDPSVWGRGTVLTDPPASQDNHGPTDVATNLLRYLADGVTLVSLPGSQPRLLAFHHRRLFAVITLTLRDGLILSIEATADPAARFG